MNLRGKVIPVGDLRLKFGMPRKEDTARTCIVVVQVKGMAGLLTMGLVVDEVSEVLSISAQQIDEAPAFGASVDTTFILGMGKIGQKVVILLDIQTVLTAQEMAQVEQVAAAA
jgi:purine-binding chemotaxis protein CheW